MSNSMANGRSYCDAPKRGGGTCTRPAGWGTPNKKGPCKNHGGAAPGVIKHHARAEAYEFIRGQPGAQVPIDPLDAATKAVELAHGMCEYWREEIADALVEEKPVTHTMLEGYRAALQDLSRMTEAANRAGVADRMAALTERAVDQVTLAFEQTLMAFKDAIDPEVRSAMGKKFGDELRKAEATPAPLELTA